MEEFYDTEDAELSFLLSSKGSADVMSFVTSLANELEAGGIEQYLLSPSGADNFICTWVVEQRDSNKNSPLAALLWDALAIVGLATHWHNADARKRAIDA